MRKGWRALIIALTLMSALPIPSTSAAPVAGQNAAPAALYENVQMEDGFHYVLTDPVACQTAEFWTEPNSLPGTKPVFYIAYWFGTRVRQSVNFNSIPDTFGDAKIRVTWYPDGIVKFGYNAKIWQRVGW